MEHLLLLHGAIGAKDQLTTIAENLDTHFTIHTFNFSGHGGAPMPERFSIPLFAAEVIAYLDKHGLQNVNIFGYSMGGFVAVYLARHFPARVGKVVTLATKFEWDPLIASREAGMLHPDIIQEKLPGFAAQLKARHQPNDWKIVLAKTKEMLLALGENNILPLADCNLVSAECLLLLGEKDKMVTREETLAVQQMIPHAGLEILIDTPHPIEGVNTALLAKIIKEFIGPGKEQGVFDSMID